jgi:hypothetical protein
VPFGLISHNRALAYLMDGSVRDFSYNFDVIDVVNVDDDITKFNELLTPLLTKRDDVLDNTAL